DDSSARPRQGQAEAGNRSRGMPSGKGWPSPARLASRWGAAPETADVRSAGGAAIMCRQGEEWIPMQLNLPDDSLPLRDLFARFFQTESTSARVRAAEPVGFDAELWRGLVELQAPLLRVAEAAGGGGLGLYDAC